MLGKFEIDTLQDDSGNAIVVSGATVEVRRESTGTLAQLYGSQDGDTQSPPDTKSNPFTASESKILFYVSPTDSYRVKITKGALERTLRHVEVTKTADALKEDLASTSNASLGDALVGYKNPETGGSARTVHAHLVDRPILATDFGLNADGVTDDSTPLTNAIAASIANGSRKILVPSGTIAIASGLTISTSGVRLEGVGPSGSHGTGGPFGTMLRWTGPAGGTMMTIAPTEGAGNQRLDAVVLKGIGFNCAGVAAKGLVIKSIRNSVFDIYQQNATDTGFELDVVSTLGEARDTQFNTIRYAARQLDGNGATGVALRLKGQASANTSFNLFEWVDIVHSNAVGIVEENADNNVWLHVRVFRAGIGTATNSIEWQGGDTSAETCRAEVFYHLNTTVAAIAKGTSSYTVPATGIVIYTLDKDNSTPNPTIETGARVHYGTSNGIGAHFGFRQLVLADSDAAIATERGNLGTETVRIRNGSQNHAVITDGTNTWGVSIDGSGNLRFQRLAGTGSVLLPASTQFNNQAISKGAADSGGAGFAVLRVPN